MEGHSSSRDHAQSTGAVTSGQSHTPGRPELLEALEAAYRFITQPQRMDTPKDGPKTATYRIEGYNALTAKLRAAIAKAEAS